MQRWAPPRPRKAYAAVTLDAGVEPPEPVATAPSAPAAQVDITPATEEESTLPPLTPEAPATQD